MLRRSDAEESNSFLRLSPRLEELSVIWETQALVTEDAHSFLQLHCLSIQQLVMPRCSCRFAMNTSAQLCCLYLHSLLSMVRSRVQSSLTHLPSQHLRPRLCLINMLTAYWPDMPNFYISSLAPPYGTGLTPRCTCWLPSPAEALL